MRIFALTKNVTSSLLGSVLKNGKYAGRVSAAFFVSVLLLTMSEGAILGAVATAQTTPSITDPFAEQAAYEKANLVAGGQKLPEPLKSDDKQLSLNKIGPVAAVDKSTKDKTPAPTQSPGAVRDLRSVVKGAEKQDRRTKFSTTYDVDAGGELIEYGLSPKNYTDSDGSKKQVVREADEDTAYQQKNKVKESLIDRLLPGTSQPKGFKNESGDVKVYFETIGKGGIRYVVDGQSFTLTPITTAVVKPKKEKSGNTPYVVYTDVWPGVDLVYEYRGNAIKENIVIRSVPKSTKFSFRVDGATVSADPAAPGQLVLDGVFAGKVSLGGLSVNMNGKGIVSDAPIAQVTSGLGKQIDIELGAEWLARQPSTAYPIAIDPTVQHTNYIGGQPGDLSQYTAYKSDGFSCGYGTCNVNTGGLVDNGSKYWRTMMKIPFDQLNGKHLVDAYLDMAMVDNPYWWHGTTDNRTIYATWAPCFGYGCNNGGAPVISGSIGANGWLNVRELIQWMQTNNLWTGWIMVWGEEPSTASYKEFDPTYMQLNFYTDVTPPLPVPELPSSNANATTVIVTKTPQLRVTQSVDPDGDLVEYAFAVNASDGTTVWSSGFTPSRQIILPDGLLQDGATYTWYYAIRDSAGGTPIWYSPYTKGGKMRIDMRNGKDKTQTYDSMGPVSVSLSSGNAYTSVSSHSIAALGGSMGLQLDYNTPVESTNGLNAEYFNNTTWSGNPVLRRVEPDINYDWALGSPAQGVVNNDNFSGHWSGYFVAPYSGNFTFGANNDDYLRLEINGVPKLTLACCNMPAWSNLPVSLSAGEMVKLDVWYFEGNSTAYNSIIIKSDTDPTVRTLPSAWLRTAPQFQEEESGLTGHYYYDNGSHDPAQLTNKFMVRRDASVNFDWSTLAPVPGGPTDGYYVRWEGYFVAPAAGSYKFGAGGDDGYRLKVNNQTVVNNWTDHAYQEQYAATGMTLALGQTVPVVLEYFEGVATATVKLLVDAPYGKGVIEPKYLIPSARVLPSGWNLSQDVDGGLAFERLQVRQNGDIELLSGDGSAHIYAATGTGFKPPANEDAILIKNTDNSYSVTAEDGRIYIFNVDGTLRETSTPIDDRKPAALQYTYATVNAVPRLTKITDRVDPSRSGSLYYSGAAQCVVASGFDPIPSNYLCAYITTDGQRTDFNYKSGRLARVQLPGAAAYDFSYDTTTGAIASIRDVLGNDTVAAGVRPNDSSTLYELDYDQLARVISMTGPTPLAGVGRATETIEYLPSATKRHVTNSSEPNGYTQYVEYDSLLRTTKVCDVAALCATTEWDAQEDRVLSTTDPVGMKSTTLYDPVTEMPTHSYGPAPAAWYGTDRIPLAANLSKVPHSEVKYDEGINGPAIAWSNYEGKTLFGSPKLHSTGIHTTTGILNRDFTANPAPITPDAGMDGYGFSATGKLKLPGSGTYTITAAHDDALRLWVNDTLIIDDWNYTSEGATQSTNSGTFTAVAGTAYRFRMDYGHTGNPGALNVTIAGPSVAATNNWSAYLTPAYGLTTTAKTYDSTVGDVESKTNYGSTPELGLPVSTTLDPMGLNYQATATYETPGNGFLRKTARTLPGGTAYGYSYYGDLATADNPCTTPVEAFKQAGLLRHKTAPDKDGAGAAQPGKSETIYDDAGRPVASRYQNDPWTCTTYDARGRALSVTTPTINGRAGRTVSYDYAVGGNPFLLRTTDSVTGAVNSRIDIYGRTAWSTDQLGYQTVITRDANGKVTQQTSARGTETFGYDSYNRQNAYALDGVTYVTLTYDQYGRLNGAEYPQATNGTNKLRLSLVKYDALGRNYGFNFYTSDGKPISESVEFSQGNVITKDVYNFNGTTLTNTYSYDKAGRLTRGVIDNWQFDYSFGAPNASCTGLSGYNANAGKNGNRSAYSVTNTITSAVTNTTYCYNQADQLIGGNGTQIGTPVYDDHGNTTQLAGAGTPISFTYNANDQNTVIQQGSNKVEYTKTPGGSVLVKKEYRNNALDKVYKYTNGALLTCNLTNQTSCTVADKYVTLPGGVILTLKTSGSTTTPVYSVKNVHGDTLITVGATGLATSSFYLYDPFGQPVASNKYGTSTNPSNATNEGMGWAADPERKQESLFSIALTQMGARVYSPVLGRFLQIDSVEGGTDNDYAYVNDPINDQDYTGQFGLSNVKKFTSETLSFRNVATGLAAVATGVGVAACVAATAGICAGGIATVAASGGIGAFGGAVAYSTKYAGTPAFSSQHLLFSAGMSGAGSAMFAGIGILSRIGVGAALKQYRSPVRTGAPTKGKTPRLSIGQAPKIYQELSIVGKILNPIHVHIESGKLWVDLNWLGKGFGIKW